MENVFSNLPAVILVTLLIAFLVFTGMRLGLPFLVRRVAGLIFVLFGASFITFWLGHFAPTNAVDGILGDKWTAEKAAVLYHHYGLDLPPWTQYWNYLNRLLHFDLGESWLNPGQSVWGIISRQLPASMLLGLSAIFLALLVGISAGMIAALRANSRYDTSIQGASLFFFALPTFVLIPFYQVAMIFLYNHDIPNLPLSSTDFGFSRPDQMIAPILIFALVQIAFWIRITRTSTLEVLRQDYVRTAKAKGLSQRSVVWRHTFRNALIPLVTAVGPAIALIVNGAFITERLFNINGIGTTALQSILQNNFPVLEGTVMLLAITVALMNIATDVAYGIVDPRIKSV
jgi:ABC-type dipeptide/oligopeptide/nickel transport system permease component